MPVQRFNRAIMYRAYPTSERQVLLSKTFRCVRFVWNHMLTDAQQFLNEAGTFFIPTLAKYKKEFPFLKEVDSLALADRSWTCSACGTTHNRDHNAAINNRNIGLLGLYPAYAACNGGENPLYSVARTETVPNNPSSGNKLKSCGTTSPRV